MRFSRARAPLEVARSARAAALATALAAVGCGGDNEAPACPWETDPLLAEVGVDTFERVDCGLTNAAFQPEVVSSFDCLSNAREAGQGAEFTVITCTDCWIASTFVSTPAGDSFHIFTERDVYGDTRRESRVESCAAVELTPGPDASEQVSCLTPTPLFSCEGKLSDALTDG